MNGVLHPGTISTPGPGSGPGPVHSAPSVETQELPALVHGGPDGPGSEQKVPDEGAQRGNSGHEGGGIEKTLDHQAHLDRATPTLAIPSSKADPSAPTCKRCGG